MNRRLLTVLPIITGSAAGALFALFEAYPKTANETVPTSALQPPPARPPTPTTATAGAPAAQAELEARPPSSAAVRPSAAASTASSGAGPTSAPTSAEAASPARRAFDLTEPATSDALLSAQVQCNRSSPEDCERAAIALESGKLGMKDAPRARSLRRIALTRYVKQCEGGRALACARLAEMYDAGDIVQQNPRNAEALRTRVRELCTKRPAEPGCSH